MAAAAIVPMVVNRTPPVPAVASILAVASVLAMASVLTMATVLAVTAVAPITALVAMVSVPVVAVIRRRVVKPQVVHQTLDAVEGPLHVAEGVETEEGPVGVGVASLESLVVALGAVRILPMTLHLPVEIFGGLLQLVKSHQRAPLTTVVMMLVALRPPVDVAGGVFQVVGYSLHGVHLRHLRMVSKRGAWQDENGNGEEDRRTEERRESMV